MKRSLLYLLILFPALCSAQNFQPGFVVKLNGDTLKGFINYKERSTTPTSLNYRSSANSKTQVFKSKEILSYTVNGKAAYERFVVNISMNEEAIARLSRGLDTTSKRDTVLLQVLQTGKNASLYTYSDALKVRFYIKEATASEPVELAKQVFMKTNGLNQMVVVNEYQTQLVKLLRKYVTGQFKDEHLSRLRYTGKDLGEIVLLINDQQVKKSLHAATRYFVGAGFYSTHNKYTGDNDLANASSKSTSSLLPMFSAGVDLFGNPAIRRLVYRIEISLSSSKGDISTVTDNQARAVQRHTFDQSTLQLTPTVLYNIYNKERIQFYLGAGAGLSASKYKNNITSITNSFRKETVDNVDFIQFEEFNFAVQLSAGLVVNKRFEFYAKYFPQSSITDYVYFNIVSQRVGFGVNYLFGKP